MAIAMADTHLDLSMADPHPDLAPTREGSGTDTRGQKGDDFILLFMFFSFLLGVLFVVLCFKADSTRPELIRQVVTGGGERAYVADLFPAQDIDNSDCAYTSNRKSPLINGIGAFLCLAIVMVAQHKYLVFYVSKSYPNHTLLMTLDPHDRHELSNNTRKTRIIFLIIIWIIFAVAEITLLVGISVEVRHSKWWLSPGTNCDDGPRFLFFSAATFGFSWVIFATDVSTEALKAQWLLLLDQERVPQEIDLT